MTTKEKIEVMQAFEDGKEIYFKSLGSNQSLRFHEGAPEWNWAEYHYCLHPAPASLMDRIKAEYGEYRVAPCRRREESGDLIIDIAGRPLHISAQSMEGFYRYVYDDVHGGQIFSLYIRPLIFNNNEVVHPVAVLFTK